MNDPARPVAGQEARGGQSRETWSFAVDWYVPPVDDPDPAAEPTDADIAFDRMVDRERDLARRTRIWRDDAGHDVNGNTGSMG